MVFDVNKKQVQFEFPEDMPRVKDLLYLENKNMFRLKTEKTKNIQGFLQFWCSYKNNSSSEFQVWLQFR